MESSSSVTCQRRRRMVQAILSPPTVPLLHFEPASSPEESVQQKDKKKCVRGQDNVQCCLCECSEEAQSPLHTTTVALVKSVMSQFGLDFGEDGTYFCAFCSIQLNNLVSLKKEVDRMTRRLSTTVIGLHALVTMSTKPQDYILAEENQDEDDTSGTDPECTTSSSFNVDDVIDIKDEVVVGDVGDVSEEHEGSFLFPEEAATHSSDNLINPPSDPSFPPPQRSDTAFGERRFPCALCGKLFKTKPYLRQHQAVHVVDRPFACTQCPKTFAREHDCKRHQSVHTGERPFACRQCPKRFARKSQLDLHVEALHGEIQKRALPFQCSRCSRRFHDKDKLRRHLKSHSPPRDKGRWLGRLEGAKSPKFEESFSLPGRLQEEEVDGEECESAIGVNSIEVKAEEMEVDNPRDI